MLVSFRVLLESHLLLSPPNSPLLSSPLLSSPLLSFLLLSCSMAFYLEEVMSCTRSLLLVVSGWVPRHVVGAVLVSLPAISVLSHLTCSVHLPLQVNLSLDGCWDKNLWENESKGRDCAVCGHSSRSTPLLRIAGLHITLSAFWWAPCVMQQLHE